MWFKAFLILLTVPNVAGAEPPSPVALISEPFTETWRPAAEISGSLVVGYTAASGQDVTRTTTLVEAAVPAAWRGTDLCLQVISADGRYESRNSYRVSADWQGGTTLLPYPSPNHERLIGLDPAEMSGALWQGSCQNRNEALALVKWRGGSTPLLLLNTGRADETLLLFPEKPEWSDVECSPTRAMNKIAFDTICALPPEAGVQESLTVSVITFRGGERGPGAEVSLRGAAR